MAIADDQIAFFRANPPNADRVAALIAQLLFVETQAHSFLGDEDDFVVAVGQLRVDQAIVLLDLDGDDAAFPDVAVIGEVRFLHDARSGGEERCEDSRPRSRPRCSAPVPDFLAWTRMVRGDFFVGAQFQQVRDRAALGGAAHLRNLINFLDVGAA